MLELRDLLLKVITIKFLLILTVIIKGFYSILLAGKPTKEINST